uniref:Uncharacterized protein n=1 Tax=Arundo donax TaxID=35708 RepID=A0A0A9GS11_ARUDO
MNSRNRSRLFILAALPRLTSGNHAQFLSLRPLHTKLKPNQLLRVLRRLLLIKTPLTLNPLKVIILIRNIVIVMGSFSGRVNPLRVGLLSGNPPRSDLLSLQCSHQWV